MQDSQSFNDAARMSSHMQARLQTGPGGLLKNDVCGFLNTTGRLQHLGEALYRGSIRGLALFVPCELQQSFVESLSFQTLQRIVETDPDTSVLHSMRISRLVAECRHYNNRDRVEEGLVDAVRAPMCDEGIASFQHLNLGNRLLQDEVAGDGFEEGASLWVGTQND
eukprot:CAMPEP_0194777548 /NCGR_PEP_ID=MMETSP0323_2-20130528/65923_1 /TAXON_ID=2866 ORGANISM="Crypthecodinium cohnii, Strain Seligo" /NCGR_SAMPLE_ID=MMETSP0323_2 /ASSEMBLY_ACC=CAM_ASM_000346 /LENGTH=165 /DNA_ID=CAMNT_0039714393 /DNA_START=203 /DNA_END=700 /DNA_ORIENTATION=+